MNESEIRAAVMRTLHKIAPELGVRIDPTDHARLVSVDDFVAYLALAMNRNSSGLTPRSSAQNS